MPIHLRPWEVADVPKLVQIVQDSLIAQYTQVPSPYGHAEAERFIAGSRLTTQSIPLAVTNNDIPIGAVSIRQDREFSEVGRLGYFTARWARRQGAASVAVAALASEALSRGLFNKTEAWIDASNVASIRLVQGLGFTHEGTLTRRARHAGRLTDMVVYAFTRSAELPPSHPLRGQLRALLDQHIGASWRADGSAQ